MYLLTLIILLIWAKDLNSQETKRELSRDEVIQALEAIHKENTDLDRDPSDLEIPHVADCIISPDQLNPACPFRYPVVSFSNEVHLRWTRYKSHDEHCTADLKFAVKLLHPPPLTTPSPPNYDNYIAWQNEILDSGLTFCNPLKHLYCAPMTQTCECRPGMEWTPGGFTIPAKGGKAGKTVSSNICVFPLDGACKDHFAPYRITDPNITTLPTYFYPLHSRSFLGGERPISAPNCGPNACVETSYLQTTPFCATIASLQTDFKSEAHFITLPKIGFRLPCKVEDHNRLYSVSPAEKLSTSLSATRKKILDDLLARDAKGFCDLKRFLTCDGTSQNIAVCECIPPTTASHDPNTGGGKCVLPHEFNTCDMPTAEKSRMLPILKNISLTSGARADLIDHALPRIMTDCRNGMECHVEMENGGSGGIQMYCTCPPGRIGNNCDGQLTKFLSMVRIPNLASDVADNFVKLRLFGVFNQIAIQFQNTFKLMERSQCNRTNEMEAENLIARIRRLDLIGTRMTRAEYDELSRSIIEATTLREYCFREFPPVRMELKCQITTSSCETEDTCAELPQGFCSDGTITRDLEGACLCNVNPTTPRPETSTVQPVNGSGIQGLGVNARNKVVRLSYNVGGPFVSFYTTFIFVFCYI